MIDLIECTVLNFRSTLFECIRFDFVSQNKSSLDFFKFSSFFSFPVFWSQFRKQRDSTYLFVVAIQDRSPYLHIFFLLFCKCVFSQDAASSYFITSQLDENTPVEETRKGNKKLQRRHKKQQFHLFFQNSQKIFE